MAKELSERQERMLRFIREFIREYRFPPTIRQIGEEVGITSTSVVKYNLDALERKGYIERDREISRGMFPGYPINSVTNGVHAVTWAARPFRELFDRHIPEWRKDNLYLRYARSISLSEILAAPR